MSHKPQTQSQPGIAPAKQIILGIDPGLNITGYAVLLANSCADPSVPGLISPSDLSLVEAGIIRSTKSKTTSQRLVQLHSSLRDIIESFTPDVMAMEELYSHYQRPRTAILMGHARGAFLLAAGQSAVHVANYSATQIKKVLTGNGRAPKDQVQLAVMRQFNLNEPPDPPDVADAIAIATCHYYLTRATTVETGIQ